LERASACGLERGKKSSENFSEDKKISAEEQR
jgi:hypothetical protein